MSILNYIVLLLAVSLVAQADLSAQNERAKSDKKNPSLANYENYIDANNDVHLKEYAEFVSIPSISSVPSHKPDVEKAAAWIVNKLISIGMTTAQLIPTEGNPVVFGSWDKAKDKPTVLIYAHYDVQPVKESEWVDPPFFPKIKDGKIIGRGTSDDKCGVMIPVWAVEAMLNTDKKLPVNIKLVFEGEEEIASPNFKKFITGNHELLKADFALNGDASQFSDSVPSIIMNLRGGARLAFTVKTADIEAHSGLYGGKTPNAAVAMSQIIASFFNKDGSVAVEGFYNKVLPLTAAENEMIKRIPYSPAHDMKLLGTIAETGDTNYSPLERIWYRPTLEIVGIQSGYIAKEGFLNIVPGNAMARITCRTVNDQSGKEVIDAIVKHINKNCPAGATLSYQYFPIISPFKFPADTKEFNYVSEALTKIYGRPPLQIGMGASVGPLIEIKEQLGIYPYSLGFQQADENQHASNEFCRLSDIRKGQLVYCYYLRNLAGNKTK